MYIEVQIISNKNKKQQYLKHWPEVTDLWIRMKGYKISENNLFETISYKIF